MTFAAASSVPVDTPEARRYNRLRRRLTIADTVLGLAFLLLLLLTGWTRNLRDFSLRLGRDHYALALFFYVAALAAAGKLAGLGLDFYAFRLEHRFHLSNQKLGGWLWDQVKGWLVGLIIGAILAELVYLTLRLWPQHWWLIAWLAFVTLFIFFVQIAPVVLLPLFYKFVPLENEELKARLVRLSERAGTRVRGVYEWKLSAKSKKANAALTGLGATRRILLSDTLLAGYSHDEIEAVLAHELGHHVHRHIVKSIVVQLGVTLAGFWAANAVLRYAIEQRRMFDSLYDFANLPLLALVSTTLSFLVLPALNAYSRHNERQADRYCWSAIANVAPFISSMDKLCQQNLAERAPSRWVEWFFHSHPSISKRIAAAQAWDRKKHSALSIQHSAT